VGVSQLVNVTQRPGAARPLPGARGFSPTPTGDGRQLMTTFAGRVELRDLNGTLLRELTDSIRIGYYSRVDAQTFVLFINDPQRRIVIYDVSGKTLETVSLGAVTPLIKVPNENAYTFAAETGFPPTPRLRPAAMATRSSSSCASSTWTIDGYRRWPRFPFQRAGITRGLPEAHC
jgi:hypothetical protein